MNRIIVSFSGGMDSATLLALALDKVGRGNVMAVGFMYPSKHNPLEREAAAKFAAEMGVPYACVDVSSSFALSKSALLTTGGPIPEGHYEAESMRQTVVPGRNLIFLSVLAAVAESRGYDEVWIGAHAGDHLIYPDCRPEFVGHARNAIYISSSGSVIVRAPFQYDDKSTILMRGRALKVPYELTRTCYSEKPISCGRCGSCQERLEAFAQVGVPDPLEYLSRELMPKNPIA